MSSQSLSCHPGLTFSGAVIAIYSTGMGISAAGQNLNGPFVGLCLAVLLLAMSAPWVAAWRLLGDELWVVGALVTLASLMVDGFLGFAFVFMSEIALHGVHLAF